MPLGSGTGRWELRQRGIKGVRVHDDSRFGGVEIDCDHIEAAWTFMEVPAREIVECHPRNAALLPAGHRRRGAAEFPRHARFDFHEHKRRPVPRDDVDFAEPRAVTPLNNCVPPPLQFGASEVFTRNAEELARITGHVDADLQGARRRTSTVGRLKPAPTHGQQKALRREFRGRCPPPASSAPAAVKGGSRCAPRRAPAVRV